MTSLTIVFTSYLISAVGCAMCGYALGRRAERRSWIGELYVKPEIDQFVPTQRGQRTDSRAASLQSYAEQRGLMLRDEEYAALMDHQRALALMVCGDQMTLQAAMADVDGWVSRRIYKLKGDIYGKA